MVLSFILFAFMTCLKGIRTVFLGQQLLSSNAKDNADAIKKLLWGWLPKLSFVFEQPSAAIKLEQSWHVMWFFLSMHLKVLHTQSVFFTCNHKQQECKKRVFWRCHGVWCGAKGKQGAPSRVRQTCSNCCLNGLNNCFWKTWDLVVNFLSKKFPWFIFGLESLDATFVSFDASECLKHARPSFFEGRFDKNSFTFEFLLWTWAQLALDGSSLSWLATVTMHTVIQNWHHQEFSKESQPSSFVWTELNWIELNWTELSVAKQF